MAVPVALSKIFRHSCIYVRTGAGIEKPQDLRGKRVGTSQYSSTGLVFMRGMLQHDYGVQVGGHALVHGRAQHVRRAAADPARTCRRRSSSIFSPAGRRSKRCSPPASSMRCCRSTSRSCFLDGSPHIARLFPNFKEVEQDYYRRTKHLSDHAHRRGARGRAPRAPVGGARASTGRSARRATSRSTASTTPMRCGWRCRG